MHHVELVDGRVGVWIVPLVRVVPQPLVSPVDSVHGTAEQHTSDSARDQASQAFGGVVVDVHLVAVVVLVETVQAVVERLVDEMDEESDHVTDVDVVAR